MGKVFDREAAIDRVDGDWDLLRELVQIFMEEYERERILLRTALVNSKADDVRKISHTLKGAAGNIGAMHVFDCAFVLERLGQDNNLGDGVAALRSFEAAIDEFKKAFASEHR